MGSTRAAGLDLQGRLRPAPGGMVAQEPGALAVLTATGPACRKVVHGRNARAMTATTTITSATSPTRAECALSAKTIAPTSSAVKIAPLVSCRFASAVLVGARQAR